MGILEGVASAYQLLDLLALRQLQQILHRLYGGISAADGFQLLCDHRLVFLLQPLPLLLSRLLHKPLGLLHRRVFLDCLVQGLRGQLALLHLLLTMLLAVCHKLLHIGDPLTCVRIFHSRRRKERCHGFFLLSLLCLQCRLHGRIDGSLLPLLLLPSALRICAALRLRHRAIIHRCDLSLFCGRGIRLCASRARLGVFCLRLRQGRIRCLLSRLGRIGIRRGLKTEFLEKFFFCNGHFGSFLRPNGRLDFCPFPGYSCWMFALSLGVGCLPSPMGVRRHHGGFGYRQKPYFLPVRRSLPV